MISSKRAQQRETLWMPDKQGLVSVTMNQINQKKVLVEEKKRKKVQLTVLALLLELCPCKKRQKQRQEKTEHR